MYAFQSLSLNMTIDCDLLVIYTYVGIYRGVVKEFLVKYVLHMYTT